jgi:prolyl 4-hydroxylase
MTMAEAATTPDPEFQALVRSRYAGNPQAMTALGARLIVGRDAPRSPVDGAALISEAAQQGDAAAWPYLAVLAAAGVGRAQNWAEAFDALGRAAGLGEEKAARQIALLRDTGVPGAGEVEAWIAAATGETLHDSPRLVTFTAFLTPALCAHLMHCAASRLEAAQVYDVRRRELKRDPMRTNAGTAFSLIDTDLVMQLIRARIARAAGLDFTGLEPPEVLHYSVGEQYKPHVDFFHTAMPAFAEEVNAKGQRVKTCLVYLNDDFEGGETDFPKIGVKYRGRTGGALIFDNVGADGTGDFRTLHSGLPPTRGEKWLFSQWMRDKPQPVA